MVARFRPQVGLDPEGVAALLCGLCVIGGWLALHFAWVGLALLLLPLAYGIGGYGGARSGLTTLLQEQELDVDLLMIVAALGAAGLGLWQRDYFLIVDGAVLILIFAISGALESYAMGQTARSIQSLMKLTPDIARVLADDDQESPRAIAQLRVGDRLRVKPGELIPVDSQIVAGTSTLNEAAITGESMPVTKTVGDGVFAGTLNGQGSLTLLVNQPPESSLIQRVIRLVETAQQSAPPSQQWLEQVERGYAKVIVLVGLALAVLPPFLWQWDWKTTIYRALIFLVVASPCALMAAIMPTLLSAMANGARQGILFKNGAQLERLGQVRAIAFDKTGTLTTGSPQVVQVIAASGWQPADVLHLAAALESHSEHPLGQAICRAASANSLPRSPITDPITAVQAIPGQGIQGWLGAEAVRVGTAAFVTTADAAPLPLGAGAVAESMAKSVTKLAERATKTGSEATDRPRSSGSRPGLSRSGAHRCLGGASSSYCRHHGDRRYAPPHRRRHHCPLAAPRH